MVEKIAGIDIYLIDIYLIFSCDIVKKFKGSLKLQYSKLLTKGQLEKLIKIEDFTP